MPNWKKVIVSGSNAFLANITASGNISASGKFIGTELFSQDDLTLDADGADILLKDGGTEFGRFKRDSSNFIIKSATQDKDIVFRGNDGGGTVDALTLDMSEGGKGIFTAGLTVTGSTTFKPISSGNGGAILLTNQGYSGVDNPIMTFQDGGGNNNVVIGHSTNDGLINIHDQDSGAKLRTVLSSNFSAFDPGTTSGNGVYFGLTSSLTPTSTNGKGYLKIYSGNYSGATAYNLQINHYNYAAGSGSIGLYGIMSSTSTAAPAIQITSRNAEKVVNFGGPGFIHSNGAQNNYLKYGLQIGGDFTGNNASMALTDGSLIMSGSTGGFSVKSVSSEAEIKTNDGDTTLTLGTTSSFSYVSASAFKGDGSQLTNLPAASTPTLAQVVTAGASAAGDVSITGSLIVSGSFNAFRVVSTNLVLGTEAGKNLNSGAVGNVILGNQAGMEGSGNTDNNVFIGDSAGEDITGTSRYNAFIGYQAGKQGNNKTDNVALGYNALAGRAGSDSADGNVAIGYNAANQSLGASYTIALGYNAVAGNASSGFAGRGNIGIGRDTISNLGSSGAYNTAIGYYAGKGIQSGDANIVIGSGSLGFAAMSNQLRIGHADLHIISGSLTTGDLIFANDVTVGGDLNVTGTGIASSNVAVGTTIDPGISLKVDAAGPDDQIAAVLKGRSTSATDFGLLVQNSSATNILMVKNSGVVEVTGTTTLDAVTNDSTVANTKLTGSFTGSFVGDGSGLTGLPAATAGSTSGRVVFTTTSGELTTEDGFDYNSSTNQLTVESLNVVHLTSSFITSSRIHTSGSNIFGDDTTDTQTLIGTTIMTGSAQVTGSVDILSGSLKVRGATALTGANIFEIKNTSADAFDDLFAFDDNGKITHEVDGTGDKHVIQTTSGATMFKFGVSAGSQGYLQIQNNGFTGAYLNNYGGAFGFGATVPSNGKSLNVLGDAQITGSLTVSGSFLPHGNSATSNVVIGTTTGPSGGSNVIIGTSAGHATTNGGNVAIGASSTNGANANFAVAIGNFATNTGTNAIAIGYSTSAGGNGIAIGRDAEASSNGIAIGKDITANASQLEIGFENPTISASLSTGHVILSGSTGGLELIGSGSTMFEVIGSEGTLFTVDDDLDGVIFTANDRNGNPTLQASASGEVYIGRAPQSLYTTAVISSTSAATTQSIFGLSTSSYGGAFFDYTVQSGSDARAGSIMSVWNGGNISFTETTTTDIGDTTDFNVIVHISQSQAQIASHATRAGYNIKTIIRSI